MKILIDTQVFLWWNAGSDRLSDEATRLLADSNTIVVLSAASSWEIAIKYRLRKIHLPEPPQSYVVSRMARERIIGLPIEHVHALAVASLPLHHRDPFDRILIAQAQVEQIPILTADSTFGAYDLKIILAGR